MNQLSSKLTMLETIGFKSEDDKRSFKLLVALQIKMVFDNLATTTNADIKLLAEIIEHEFFRPKRRFGFFTKNELPRERSPSQLILDELLSTLLNNELSDDQEWELLGKNDNEFDTEISPRK